jgi:hypothetical protein
MLTQLCQRRPQLARRRRCSRGGSLPAVVVRVLLLQLLQLRRLQRHLCGGAAVQVLQRQPLRRLVRRRLCREGVRVGQLGRCRAASRRHACCACCGRQVLRRQVLRRQVLRRQVLRRQVLRRDHGWLRDRESRLLHHHLHRLHRRGCCRPPRAELLCCKGASRVLLVLVLVLVLVLLVLLVLVLLALQQRLGHDIQDDGVALRSVQRLRSRRHCEVAGRFGEPVERRRQLCQLEAAHGSRTG